MQLNAGLVICLQVASAYLFLFLLTLVKIEIAFYNVGMNDVKTMKCDYTNDLSISRASLADRDTDDLSLATFSRILVAIS